MLKFVLRCVLPAAAVFALVVPSAGAAPISFARHLPDCSAPQPPIILAGVYVRKIKRGDGSLRYVYGYRPYGGQGIAGTPYRSGFSDRAFKSSGFGFTEKIQSESYSKRKFRSSGIGFSKGLVGGNRFSKRRFRSSGPRFQKNFFGSRPFRSNGGGFGF